MDTHEQIPDSHFDSIEEPTVEQEYREYNAREQYRREQNLKAAEEAEAAREAEAAPGPIRLLLSPEMAQYFAVIDGKLYAASPARGDYIRGDGKHPATIQITHELLRQAGYGDIDNLEARDLRDIMTTCQKAAERPEMYGIVQIKSEETNRVPALSLKDGVLDLRYGVVRQDEEARKLFCIRPSGGPVEYRPEMLDNPPAAAQAFIAHFGERLFRRMAYSRLKTDKHIDVVRIATPDAGKTTLTWLDNRAFPGVVDSGAAKTSVAGHGGRFSRMNRVLAESRMMWLDEADKAESKYLGPDNMNRLADRYVDVERKGIDMVKLPRVGNAWFIGNDWPPLMLGLGSEARFVWAYDEEGAVLPKGMAVWCETEEAVLWFRAYMVRVMREVWSETYELDREFVDPEGTAAAKRMLEDLADPLVVMLRGLFVKDRQGWVSSAEIRSALEQAITEGKLDLTVPDARKFGALVKTAFPDAKSKQGGGGEQRPRGYEGIARREF